MRIHNSIDSITRGRPEVQSTDGRMDGHSLQTTRVWGFNKDEGVTFCRQIIFKNCKCVFYLQKVFSKYLLLGFLKFYTENPKFYEKIFFTSLSFPTLFLCVKDLEVETGYFLIVYYKTLNMHYYLHNRNLYTLKISSFIDVKMDTNQSQSHQYLV